MSTSRVSNSHHSANLSLPPYKAVEAFTASSNSLSRLSSKNIAYSLSAPASERQSAHWSVSSHRTQSICHSFDGSKMSRPISLERPTLSTTSHSSLMTRISSQTLPPPPSYPTTHALSLPPPPYLRSPIRSTIHNAWIGSRAVGDFPLCASRTSALRSTVETLGSPEDELKDSFVETSRLPGISPPMYPRGAALSYTRENSYFREAPRFHGIAASACESDDSSCESDSDSDSIDSFSTRCDLYVKAPRYSHSSSSSDEPHTPLTPELRPLHSFNRSDSRGTINSDVYDDMDVHVADEDEESTWRGPRSPSFRPGLGTAWNDFRRGHRTRSGDFIIINEHSPFLTKNIDRAQPRTHPGVNLQGENRTQPVTRPTIASLCSPPADVVAIVSHQNPKVSAASSSSPPSPSTPSISSKRKAQEVEPTDALEDAAASGPKPKRPRSGTSVVHEPIKASIPPPVPDQPPVVQEQVSCEPVHDFLTQPNVLPHPSGPNLSVTGNPAPTLLYPQRSFPLTVPINPYFQLFYRQFPISSYFAPSDPLKAFIFQAMSEKEPQPMNRLVFNPPNGPLDLYTPRFVRGSGGDKVGLCPICIEPVERGGRGLKMFAKTKVSAYNYHLQYYHGISSKTGLPYSPPIEFRTTLRDATFEPDDTTKPRFKCLPKKTARKNMMEGRCHACGEWVALQGTKDVDVLVKELYWWKHAASCHRGTTIAGEGDYFVHDEVWARIREYSRQKELL